LGTLAWGRDVDQNTSRKLLKAFVDAGGNLIDTAPTYSSGIAERLIGSALRHIVPRESLVIATKAGLSVDEGRQAIDTSRVSLLRELDASLERLGTSYVDIWQVHAWGDAPLDETLSALDYAVSSGKARAVGVCNYVGWQLGTATAWQLSSETRAMLTTAQNEYSLLARRCEVEVLPAVTYHELGFFAWSPLGRGVLTGKYRGAPVPETSRGASPAFSWFVEPYLQPRCDAIVDAVTHAASGLEVTPEQIALSWVRDAPAVTSALVGPRTLDHLKSLLAAEDVELPPIITSALDDITGGPNELREL
jgi:aryl-alcohol dehydrogenase-like predicted oxidoreductase